MKPTADAELLGRLLDEQGPALALYAAQWTPAADDCVQEALIELARQSPLPENPVAWLYRVVKHRALNAARGERRRLNHEQNSWRGRLIARKNLASRTNNENHLELIDALSQLTDDVQEVVVLKTWGGLTFTEIAQVTGESSSTAHRRYDQALTHLRKIWGVECAEMTNLENISPE
jgi:RNA polymerase sigma factor (sigma-70 family)